MNRIYIAALLTVVGLFARAQQEPTATIYVFTVGKRVCCDHFTLDHVDIGKIAEGKVAKFLVLPGYHEVQAHLSRLNGISSIKAEPGREYYVQAEISYGQNFGMGIHALDFHLHSARGLPSDAKLKEEKVSEKVLARVLEASRNFQHSEPEQYISSTEPVGMLTDDEVAEAVLQGSNDRSVSNIGLLLNDLATNVMTHLDGALTKNDTGVSGFTILVYTPKRWVEYLAALAHVQMRPSLLRM